MNRFRNRDSKTIPPGSETAFHKLLSTIQKLLPTNSETTIQNLLPTASETTVQKLFVSSYSVVVRHTNAKLQEHLIRIPPSHPAASQKSIAPGTFD